jgi:hypothetical protein
MIVKIYARTRYVGSKDIIEIEVDDEEWNSLTDDEKNQYMQDEYENSSLVEWGWEELTK